MTTTEQRIKMYSDEIEIIEEGITAYKSNNLAIRPIDSYENKRKISDLNLELKSKTAAMLQLSELMKESEATFKAELKHMRENWQKILRQAKDGRDRLNHDNKKLLDGIKNSDNRKSWLSPKHQLQAFKMLMNLVNQNSNGKSI